MLSRDLNMWDVENSFKIPNKTMECVNTREPIKKLHDPKKEKHVFNTKDLNFFFVCDIKF